jgi:hypothetical protein
MMGTNKKIIQRFDELHICETVAGYFFVITQTDFNAAIGSEY